jgi:SHS2 domain-containing protein
LEYADFQAVIFVSHWQLSATADIGIRAFSNNKGNLFREVTLGMQNITLSEKGSRQITGLVRATAEWSVQLDNCDQLELLLLKWLDEVLFMAEVEGKFLIDLQPMLTVDESNVLFRAQVSYVPLEMVERGIEIKAVTSHGLQFKEVQTGELVTSDDLDIPTFEGPGWHADVLFDI